MGDPVGSPRLRKELAWEFRELADRHGARAVFYQVRRHNLPLYLDMGLSLLKRLRPTSGLADLPPPRTIDDLRTKGYVLAALKDSRAHHFCATSLKRSEDSLLVCNSVEEALDRVL